MKQTFLLPVTEGASPKNDQSITEVTLFAKDKTSWSKICSANLFAFRGNGKAVGNKGNQSPRQRQEAETFVYVGI